jgi:hypothetical protein
VAVIVGVAAHARYVGSHTYSGNEFSSGARQFVSVTAIVVLDRGAKVF